MKEGDTHFVALSWSEHAPPRTYDEAYDRLVWTAHHWQHWLDHGEFPDHPWRTFLQRSALTLKGLSSAPTGALVAAATTSLPETPGGARNWDYRFTWIRDATFMLWGLYTLGFDWEANDFFYFLADVAEAEEGDLQIMYGIDGEGELPEQTLEHLSGYDGARPVRIGNDAHRQPQHDVWGAILDSFYLHTKSRDHVPERIWPILVRHRSKLRSRTGASTPPAGSRPRRRSRPTSSPTRSTIEASSASTTRRPRSMPPCCSCLSSGSSLPTTSASAGRVDAIADELTVDDLVLRYRTSETDDGLAGTESAGRRPRRADADAARARPD